VHDVEPVELADRVTPQRLPVIGRGDVAVTVACCTAGALNLAGDSGSKSVLDICENDACALPCEESGSGRTDTAGGAGDDRYFVGEARSPELP